MKTIPFAILLIVFAFTSCKKDLDNTDPFTNGTQFDYEYNYTIVVKNDSILVSCHYTDDSIQMQEDITIEYFGDSIARKTTAQVYSSGYEDIKYETFHLDNDGFADSVNVVSNNGNYTDFFVYYPDGYLHGKSNTWQGEITWPELLYSNGNYYTQFVDIEYYPIIAKLDIFSGINRRLNNRISGKDDIYLPKRTKSTGIDRRFYYQLDSRGYVTSFIVRSDYDEDITYTRKNYTYQFIQ